MRITVEENRHAVERYAHIVPRRFLREASCDDICPGTVRRCTRGEGHSGPHVAHGPFRRVVAVWSDAVTSRARRKKPGRTWGRALWRGVFTVAASVEELAMFILFLGFAIFAVDWFLKLLG